MHVQKGKEKRAKKRREWWLGGDLAAAGRWCVRREAAVTAHRREAAVVKEWCARWVSDGELGVGGVQRRWVGGVLLPLSCSLFFLSVWSVLLLLMVVSLVRREGK